MVLSLAMRHHQRGGTAVGFLIGVIAGLAVATLVSLVVTRAPMPFINKSDRVNAKVVSPTDGGALPDPNAGLRTGAVRNEGEVQTEDEEQPVAGKTYMLQAGAYRSEVDAQSMRARLALIGYEAEIRSAKVNDETLYRVRIGPFNAIGAINAARAELANNAIDASVVRQ
jgi:cell division protein FtsN